MFQCAIVQDMISTYTRITPSKWKFCVNKIERQRRAGPLHVKHPASAANNKIIAALAVLAFALLAATERVEAAPYSRDSRYGFSECISSVAQQIVSCISKITFSTNITTTVTLSVNEDVMWRPNSLNMFLLTERSGIEKESLDTCMDNKGMERQLRSGGDLNKYLSGLAKCIASIGRPRYSMYISVKGRVTCILSNVIPLISGGKVALNRRSGLSTLPYSRVRIPNNIF